jgi:hypothetical protein
MLARAGRKSSRRFNLGRWLEQHSWARKVSFPAVKGERRMNPLTFCTQFQSGRYICRTAGHVFAVIDGVVSDMEPERADRCIYVAWMIDGRNK